MWVMKVASMSMRRCASIKPEQVGIGQARLASANHLHSGQWDRRLFRILDKVHRSKRVNSRLNERELATLQKRRGRTKLEPPNHVSGTRTTNNSPEWAARACAPNYCNEPEARVPSPPYPSAMNPQHRVPSRVLTGAQIGRKEA